MNQMIWKELRENWKWGVVLFGFLYLFSWYLYGGDRGQFFFEEYSFVSFVMITGSLGGFAFGLIQGYHESAPDRWAFLMHRSLTSTQMATAKLLVGVSIQLVCWLTFIISLALSLSLNNYLNHPFYWYTLIPALLASLAFIPMHALGLLILIWKVRRKFIKVFVLGIVFIQWMILMMSMQEAGWSALWGWGLILAISIPASIYALFKVNANYGELRSGRVGSSLYLYTGIVTSLLVAGILGVQLLSPFFAAPVSPRYHHSELWFGSSGELYKHRFETMPRDSSNKITHELYLFGDESEPIAVRQLPQLAKAAEIRSAFDVDFTPTFPSVAQSQLSSLNYVRDVSQMPLVRDTFSSIPIAVSWPRMTNSGQLYAWHSNVSGLIHIYERPNIPGAPVQFKYHPTTIVGANGFFAAEAPDAKPFSPVVATLEGVIMEEVDSNIGSVARQLVNDMFLVVTNEAIFSINASEQQVTQIYAAPIDDEIVDVRLQGVADDPLMLIEHKSRFRLLKTQKVEAGKFELEEGQPPLVSYIHLPDKEVGEFIKPESMNREDILQVAWLEQPARLLLTTQDDVVSMASTPNSFHVFELAADGDLYNRRQFANELLNPQPDTGDGSGYLMGLFAPILIVGLFIINAILVSSFSAAEIGVIDALLRYQPESMYLMTVAPLCGALLAMIVGHWYARRNRLSRSQSRLIFWIALLFGPIGLIAAWLIERRPYLYRCPHCDKKVSVAENLCSNCGQNPGELADRPTNIISPQLTLEKPPGSVTHEPQVVS